MDCFDYINNRYAFKVNKKDISDVDYRYQGWLKGWIVKSDLQTERGERKQLSKLRKMQD